MKDKIANIRGLLDQIESEIGESDGPMFTQNFNALELPGIISDIVDFLVPALQPYEASFYWYLFRHSIPSSGQQYCRVSTTSLINGVVVSSAAQKSESLGLNTVRRTLRGLEEKGVIVKHREPNRDGTPYKVLLPEEIEICQKLKRQAAIVATPKPIDVKKGLDFYNVAKNRLNPTSWFSLQLRAVFDG
jgi:hypothetical protein